MVSRVAKKYQTDPVFRQDMLNKQLERKKQNKQKAIDYCGNVCYDCKHTYHSSVYEFHHLDPNKKDKTIGYLKSHSWERIKQEIDKCVMLCANCHRLRHWNENENK